MKLNIRTAITRFFIRISYNRNVDGLWVGIIGDKKDGHLLDRVEDALKVIKQYDSFRYRQVLRDLERVWITTLIGARGQYASYVKGCFLDLRFVKTASIESIASTIVHEATHAHPSLQKFGYPESLRYRIERICMRRQLAFADRLPLDELVYDEVKRNFSRDPSHWSDRSLGERRRADERDAARSAGLPDWFVTIVHKSRTMFRREPR